MAMYACNFWIRQHLLYALRKGRTAPGGRRPVLTRGPPCPEHTPGMPARALWRRGAAGDAQSLVAAARAHGEASVLHPRRDHPLRASLRKLGSDACLTAPLVCGHAAACCGLRVRRCLCLQASLPARSAGRAESLPAGGPPPSALGRASSPRRASRLRQSANTRLPTSLVTSRQGIRARPRPRL